jgi:hypothetical protein
MSMALKQIIVLGSDSSPNLKSPTLVNALDESGSWLGKLEHWRESLVE